MKVNDITGGDQNAPASAVAILAIAGLAACGGSATGPARAAELVRRHPARRHDPGGRRALHRRSRTAATRSRELLPTDASQQREQLVRRLGAEDSNDRHHRHGRDLDRRVRQRRLDQGVAGQLKPQVTKDVFPSVIETASFEGKLYGAPFNSNTQLLWYRKDLVAKPPKTWDEMIDEAEAARGSRHDPGAGEPLRGLHRLGQRDDRVGGDADPLRPGRPSTSSRSRPRRRWR